MTRPRALDPTWVRDQFPGLHDGWTFFDNAGGTQILRGVVERMNEHLYHRNVQTGGSYAVSLAAAASLQQGREAMGTLVNARRPEEIVFAPTSTVAFQNLVRAMAGSFEPGDEVVVTVFDHESNIGPWTLLEARGVKLRFWTLDAHTLEPDLEALGAVMNERTKLVAVTWVSNILGAINPIGKITRYVHERGARICVDAVAYAAHRAIDVRALDVDYLVFSIYKVFGPHFALLYGKYEHLLELDSLYHYFYGRDRVPMKLEPGNASYELAYGSSYITEYLAGLGARCGANGDVRSRVQAAFEAITDHECALGERLLEFLRERDDVRVIGRTDGTDRDRVPTIAFKVDGMDSAAICRAVDEHRIAIRFGDFHARRLIEHLGLTHEGGVVRVSMSHYNTLGEVDALVDALRRILP